MAKDLSRLCLPEDILGFCLSEFLAGRPMPDDWQGAFREDGSFGSQVSSANHKAMAATCALLGGLPAARTYWQERFEDEIGGRSVFGYGEAGSNKYHPWSAGAVAIVAAHDASLAVQARAYLRAYVAFLSLGAVPGPIKRIDPQGIAVAGKWGGLVPAAVGCRSDPGHLDGDMRAVQLQALLCPQTAVVDAARDNAAKRVRQEDWKSAGDPALAEARRRKTLSERWPEQAIAHFRSRGGALDPVDAEACLRWIRGDRPALSRLVEMLGAIRMEPAFHWVRWADGSVAAWIEGPDNERDIFASLTHAGIVQVAFPYQAGDGALRQKSGSCARVGNRLIATSPFGSASIELPGDPPAAEVVIGSDGVKVLIP